ncbi:MAG: hypothetical protein OXE77_01620 [Flavobacteriaceae bacterium]|nr:hypothetical protein [Flavobacteriaceae bacterium]MCY4267573.1 hypothetical protein [Flavobacteriaceae bacterium]
MKKLLRFFDLIFKVDDSWQVDHISVEDRQMAIDVYVSHVGGHVVCPETGEEGSIDDHRQEPVRHP